jgi:hypothetical protein
LTGGRAALARKVTDAAAASLRRAVAFLWFFAELRDDLKGLIQR